MQTYADRIIDYLYLLGVRRIFGVPGGAISPLMDAVARHQRRFPDGLRLVVARHESGAAFMAAGYAREAGTLGVCFSTTGPGATNLITGVATALTEQDPLLVITPQIPMHNFGRVALQDSSDVGVDVVGIMAHCTRYNSFVSHMEQLETKLIKAVSVALSNPQGPVHLSIPMDILYDESVPPEPSFDISALRRPSALVDENSYTDLLDVVRTAHKMVIVIGGGCYGAAADKIMRVAEITNSAMISTPSGKTWVNAYHPLYRGVFGFAGHESARETLLDPEVDVILTIGSRLGELDTSAWDKLALLNNKLVHVDSLFENFSQSPMAKLHVYGDLEVIFERVALDCRQIMRTADYVIKRPPMGHALQGGHPLIEKISPESEGEEASTDKGYLASLVGDASIKPQVLMQHLPSVLPDDTCYVVDSGNAWAWTIHYLHLSTCGKLRFDLNFGAMTWAIGHAIGTACAAPGSPVAVITGDGSMLMAGQELTVAVAEKLPVLFIILNDQALGMVKHGQRLSTNEPIGYLLPQVDFAAVARAMGADAYTVRSAKDILKLDFDKLFARPGPSVLDVYIDPEAVPPMGVRVRTLDRRKGRRPESRSRRKTDMIS